MHIPNGLQQFGLSFQRACQMLMRLWLRVGMLAALIGLLSGLAQPLPHPAAAAPDAHAAGQAQLEAALAAPAIQVEMEDDLFYHEGWPYVMYSIRITNRGDTDFSVDSVHTTLSGENQSYLHVCNGPLFSPGMWCTFTEVYRLQPDDPDPLLNQVEVHVSGELPNGEGFELYGSASTATDWVRASIRVEKNAFIGILRGGDLLYQIDIFNDGDIDLTLVAVVDSLNADLAEQAALRGCADLAPGSGCSLGYAVHQDWETPDPLVNTVMVEYRGTLPDGETVLVSAEARHELNLFQPFFQVTKEGPDLSHPGEWITYRYTITNTSSADTPPLQLNVFEDEHLGYLNPIECRILEPGQSCTFSADYQIPFTATGGSFSSPVIVTYQVERTRWEIRNYSDHDIKLFWPSIHFEKTGPAQVRVQEPAAYQIRILNTSSEDTPQLSCTITDELLGINQTVHLMPGEEQIIHGSRVVQENDPNPLVNIARAQCWVEGFALTFPASDWHASTVLPPLPACSNAYASPANLWSPNHQFVRIAILGVSGTVRIDRIFQDEPVDERGDGRFSPDGRGIGLPTAEVRAERAGGGNGRVYTIYFTTTDQYGGSCSGSVSVGVPSSKGQTPVDDGPLYDSTRAPKPRGR